MDPQVRNMYNWHNVAQRTLKVYHQALDTPTDDSLLARLQRHRSTGLVAGWLFCLIVLGLHFWWRVAEWLQPVADIDRAEDWPHVENAKGTVSAESGQSPQSVDEGQPEQPAPTPLRRSSRRLGKQVHAVS
jgi:hypothetical protein